MKKIGSLILVAIMAASMAACSDTNEKKNDPSGAAESSTTVVADSEGAKADTQQDQGSVQVSLDTKDNFVFKYENVDILLGSEPEATLGALGEPKSYLEVPSCAHDGTDYVYTYANIVLTVSVLTGEEKGYISDVRLLSDLVATPEGLEVGMKPDKARELYGDPQTESDVQWVYSRGTSELMLTINNGSIVGIEYLIP